MKHFSIFSFYLLVVSHRRTNSVREWSKRWRLKSSFKNWTNRISPVGNSSLRVPVWVSTDGPRTFVNFTAYRLAVVHWASPSRNWFDTNAIWTLLICRLKSISKLPQTSNIDWSGINISKVRAIVLNHICLHASFSLSRRSERNQRWRQTRYLLANHHAVVHRQSRRTNLLLVDDELDFVLSTHSSERTANMILVIGISIMPWRVVNHSRTNHHERRLSALKHVNLRLYCVRTGPMVSNVGESLLQTLSYSFFLSFQRSFSTPKIRVEIFPNLCGLGRLKCVETTTRESIEKRSSSSLVRCALLR